MSKRFRDAITEYEDKLAEIHIKHRYVRQKLDSFTKDRVDDILHEHEQGRVIVSRVSDWESLELSNALPNVEVEYFTKRIYFQFEMCNGRAIANKILQLENLNELIAKTFTDSSPPYFTSHSKLEVADQCQQLLDENQTNLDDRVVWDTEERLSGICSHDIEYLHTMPKK